MARNPAHSNPPSHGATRRPPQVPAQPPECRRPPTRTFKTIFNTVTSFFPQYIESIGCYIIIGTNRHFETGGRSDGRHSRTGNEMQLTRRPVECHDLGGEDFAQSRNLLALSILRIRITHQYNACPVSAFQHISLSMPPAYLHPYSAACRSTRKHRSPEVHKMKHRRTGTSGSEESSAASCSAAIAIFSAS